MEESTTVAVNLIDIDIKEVYVEYNGSLHSPTDSKYLPQLLVLSIIAGMLIILLIAMTRKPKPLLGLSKRRFPRVPRLPLPSTSKDRSMTPWLVSLSNG